MFKRSQGSRPSWGDHSQGIASPHRDVALGKGLTKVPPAGGAPGPLAPLQAGIPSCPPGTGFPRLRKRDFHPSPTHSGRRRTSRQTSSLALVPAAAPPRPLPPPLQHRLNPHPEASQAMPLRRPQLSPPPARPGRAGPRGLRCFVPGERPRPRCRRPGTRAAALSP